MIGRKSQHRDNKDEAAPQGFDDFALQLGDVMRGERATMGKSLLDVQRELRIKASYIAAIENCDPAAFDTPGFIAGYVRSYARYLGMDPDEAFAHFCAESGFSVAHGMSQKASVVRKPNADDAPRARTRNALAEPRMPFAPGRDSFFSGIEPGAIGSSLVLLALIGGIGYGGYAVLQEVQRVQVTPVDQTPIVLSELDPLKAAISAGAVKSEDDVQAAGLFNPPTTEAFDRLYRPQALDVPVLVARDAPISTLDPDRVGVFAGNSVARLPRVQDSSLAASALAERLVAEGVLPESAAPLTAGTNAQGVTVIAARPAWVEVRDESNGVLVSRVLDAGETFAVPRTSGNARIRVGESGAVYFNVDGQTYGPSGTRGQVTGNISLASTDLVTRYNRVDGSQDNDLMAALVSLDLTTPRVAAIAPTRPLTIAELQPTVTAPKAPTVTPVARPVALAAAAPAPALPVAPTPLPQIQTAQPVAIEPVQPIISDPIRQTAVVVPTPVLPQVTATPAPGITVVATAETWVEVTSPSGKKIFARTLQAGETYEVPQTDQAPTIFSGNAGGVFFAVNGETFGPYGQSGQFGRDLALSADDIQRKMQVADLMQNRTLAKVVAELQLQGQ